MEDGANLLTKSSYQIECFGGIFRRFQQGAGIVTSVRDADSNY